MRLESSETTRRIAKRLRREMTPPEIALWRALRTNDHGLRFRRQYAAGPYILDFYCAPARLAVEIDGEAHSRGGRPERDAQRDAWLAMRGILTERLAARDVFTNLDGVVRRVFITALERMATSVG